MCTPSEGQVCHDPCIAEFFQGYSCCGPPDQPSYDGNPLFFPIDDAPNALTELRGEGKVSDSYGFAGWPWESAVATTLGISSPIATATAPFPSLTHNFHFTTEVRFWFRYVAGTSYWLDFTGDDDLWVFLNGKLAVDLGGWHVPLNGSLSVDALGLVYSSATLTEGSNPITVSTPGTDFGLVDGNLYSIAVFHAERQPEGSSFRLGLQGFNDQRSVCTR
jgi:fibro-slime domain-containing protein